MFSFGLVFIVAVSLREREDNSISTMLKQELKSKAAMPGGSERPSPTGFTRVR